MASSENSSICDKCKTCLSVSCFCLKLTSTLTKKRNKFTDHHLKQQSKCSNERRAIHIVDIIHPNYQIELPSHVEEPQPIKKPSLPNKLVFDRRPYTFYNNIKPTLPQNCHQLKLIKPLTYPDNLTAYRLAERLMKLQDYDIIYQTTVETVLNPPHNETVLIDNFGIQVTRRIIK